MSSKCNKCVALLRELLPPLCGTLGGFYVFGFLVWGAGLKPTSEKDDERLSARIAGAFLGSLLGCLCVQWRQSRYAGATLLPENGPKHSGYDAV